MAAIFDLAESVDRQTPKIRRMLRYVRVFVSVWLLLDFFFMFVLGFIILELMRDLRSFFDYFALRHRVIQRVRQADPVVYVPEGKDAVQRILAHLASSSPDVRGLMAVPGAVAIPALLTGKSGLTYSFDAYVRRSPSQLWRTVSLGSPGYAVFVI